eukprot:Phypoly_transcript_27186.p1 GENE.Phypoly_transcript_27186~~Phypoly_transcript_27186.p1  ORF type:complete len:126 (-),score=23.53 Phypoly_transcript_27186:36-413(-)
MATHHLSFPWPPPSNTQQAILQLYYQTQHLIKATYWDTLQALAAFSHLLHSIPTSSSLCKLGLSTQPPTSPTPSFPPSELSSPPPTTPSSPTSTVFSQPTLPSSHPQAPPILLHRCHLCLPLLSL